MALRDPIVLRVLSAGTTAGALVRAEKFARGLEKHLMLHEAWAWYCSEEKVGQYIVIVETGSKELARAIRDVSARWTKHTIEVELPTPTGREAFARHFSKGE